jgi:membrane protein YqaA with SNARE-associated domain
MDGESISFGFQNYSHMLAIEMSPWFTLLSPWFTILSPWFTILSPWFTLVGWVFFYSTVDSRELRHCARQSTSSSSQAS